MIKAKAFHFYMACTMAILVIACDADYTPKPRGYFRINFPEKEYKLTTGDYPFSFECPTYAWLRPDSSYDAKPNWYNVSYLPFNATLHLSYNQLTNDSSLNGLVEDSRKLVYEHTTKAEEIIENYISTPNDAHGIVYQLRGNTATGLQFYFTDSSNHYLRGALYFNARTNPDSIAPVMDFIEQDVYHLVETLKWKGE